MTPLRLNLYILLRNRLFKMKHKKKLAVAGLILLTMSFILTLRLILTYIEIDYVMTDKLAICLQDRLQKYQSLISSKDMVILNENSVRAFTGNGHIGLSLPPDSSMFLKSKDYLSIIVQDNLVADVHIPQTISQENKAVNVLDGIIFSFKCFKHVDELCIPTSSSIRVHRIQSELVLQEIRITNPTKEKIFAQLIRQNPNRNSVKFIEEKKNLDRITVELIPVDNSDRRLNGFNLSTNQTQTNSENLYILIATIIPFMEDKMTIEAFEKKIVNLKSYVSRSDNIYILPKIQSINDFNKLSSSIKDQIMKIGRNMTDTLKKVQDEVEKTNLEKIIKVHKASWNRLWESGFSITDSYADNSFNGDRYNMTLFNLLSHKPDTFSSIAHNSEMGNSMIKDLTTAKSCSDGPTVLNMNNLWREPYSDIEFVDLIKSWEVLLKHRGCSPLFNMGVHGFLQAIIYSIGSIRLSTGHVALWIRPEYLHRGLTLRNVMLAPSFVYANMGFFFDMNESTGAHVTKLFIERKKEIVHRPLSKGFLLASSYEIDAMLEEKIYVQPSVGPLEADFISGKKFESKAIGIYACSATCGPIQEVEYEREFIEILSTSPPSAILNIAVSDSENLNDVAKALHLDEVLPGGHLQHDLLLLHKHGHMLRGLPLTFWISLGILVFVFHLFLCRLIFSEFWKDDEYVLPVNSWEYESRKRKHSFRQENFSEKMASVYVNSHLANRKAYKQKHYQNEFLP